MKNPLNWIGRYTNRYFDWSEYYQKYKSNCQVARDFILDYVRKRKSGEIKSSVDKGADMLSLFFERPDVFTEEVLVDEVLDFFGAASETTQKSV